MRVRWFSTFAAVLILPNLVYAVDLTKIDRRIGVEPKYKTKSPRYCLVVFGPKAEKRVWLVRDGDVLHVDRNRNGILGEAGEKITASSTYNNRYYYSVDGVVPGANKNVSNRLWLYAHMDGVKMKFYGKKLQYVGFAKAAKTKFSSSPADAPIVHFDGPLTLGRYSEKVTLRPNPTSKSYRVTSLRLMVGTRGLGEGTFAALHCKCRKNKGNLVATFRYPSKSPGLKLLAEKVTLKTYG